MTTGPLIRGGADLRQMPLWRAVLFGWPWYVITFLLRLFYGFRVEGIERLPTQGPFILVINEYSPIAFLISGWISLVVLQAGLKRGQQVLSFLRQELFDFRFFRLALNSQAPGQYAALTPQGAGKMALTLLEAHRVLEGGGVVILNPEGDMPWDGRPLPLGHALAWLGLHSAAPIVPAIATIGAYDIWPRWQPRPNLGGRVRLRIGAPIRVCSTPQESVTDRQIAEVEGMLEGCLDELRYAPGGRAGWARPSERGPVQVTIAPVNAAARTRVAPWRRGLALVLWRCPACRTPDALLHYRPLLGAQTLECIACHTRWRVRRIPEHDFALTVTAGPAEWLGVERPLSGWYDQMKRDWSPAPITIEGFALAPGEEAWLAAEDVRFSSNLPPNPLTPFPTGEGGTALLPASPTVPGALAKGRRGWRRGGRGGTGRLVLTDRRLIWQGSGATVECDWARVSSILLWLVNTLTLQYGAVSYRLELGRENGLEWLTYAATAAQRAAERTGRKLYVSRF